MIRALTSPAAATAAVVLLLVLFISGAASSPGAVNIADHPETIVGGAGLGQADGAVRLAKVPSSPAKRRALRVLSNGCQYDQRGIPSCGVLLGAAYGSNTDPTRWEDAMDHPLGVHRTYFSGYEVDEAVLIAQDDLLHQRLPWVSFKPPYSWADMAAGRGDEWARRRAERFAKLKGPVWLAFYHEPEGDGDITQWTAMQARLAPIVRAAAPNVAFTVILTGWNQLYGGRQYSLESLWPQDTKIDLVGFDVYNKYGVERAGATVMERTRFKRHYFGMFQRFSEKHDVAWGLAETGQTDTSARVEPRFVQHVYKSVRRHGGVVVTYFNSTHNSIAPWRLIGVKARQFGEVLRTTPTL
jgi:hypothetical protein